MKEYMKYWPIAVLVVGLIGSNAISGYQLHTLIDQMDNVHDYMGITSTEDAKGHAIRDLRLDNLEKEHD